METLEQMKAMAGTSGSEKLIFLPSSNLMLSPENFQCNLAEYSARHPRIAKKIAKEAVEVTSHWTWELQTTRFSPSGYCLVKRNEYCTRDSDGSRL